MNQSTVKAAATYVAALSILLTGCATADESEVKLSAIDLRSSNSTSPTPTPSDFPSSNPVSDSFAELELEDQSGQGDRVQVEEVRLSLGSGLLVISDLSGNYLGSAIVTPDSQPVAVQLDNKINISQELIGTLYFDDGDGVFSAESDFQIRDDEGEIVREDFDYQVTGN